MEGDWDSQKLYGSFSSMLEVQMLTFMLWCLPCVDNIVIDFSVQFFFNDFTFIFFSQNSR